jgi:predicted  nucleic acid-binding Zn-ribbon protein
MALDWTDTEEYLRFLNENINEAGNATHSMYHEHISNALCNVLTCFEHMKTQITNLESDMQALHGRGQVQQKVNPAAKPAEDRNDQLSDLLFVARYFLEAARKDFTSQDTSNALKALTAKVEELE